MSVANQILQKNLNAWIDGLFRPPLFQSILHQRHFVLDQPLSIDKLGLSARFDRLHFNRAREWARAVPGLSILKTPYNYQILIHGELLQQFHLIDRALRAIVFAMHKDDLFIMHPEDEPFLGVIEPSDYLFTAVPISQVEIAFDFRDYQIPKVLRERNYTLYSDDFKLLGRHSIFYFYNRINSLLAKNQHNHQAVQNLRYAYRAEFQLNSHACPYLNLANLQGTTDNIVTRFFNYLAGQFQEWAPSEFAVQDLDNDQYFHDLLFNQVWPREDRVGLVRTGQWNDQTRESLLIAKQFQ